MVVRAEDLRKLIQEDFGDDDSWLWNIAKILGTDKRNVYRKLYEQKHVTWSVADEWLTQLGMVGQIHYLEAIPNPRWSQEKWIKHMKERGCI